MYFEPILSCSELDRRYPGILTSLTFEAVKTNEEDYKNTFKAHSIQIQPCWLVAFIPLDQRRSKKQNLNLR